MKEKQDMTELGRKGGNRTFETRGNTYFSEIGRLGAKVRWAAKKKVELEA